jgi:hypothetical protein
MALGLCLVAIVGAFLPQRGPALSPVSTWAALAALALAFWASWPPRLRFSWTWPWQRPRPVRNTVASILLFVGIALVVLGPLERRLVGDEFASMRVALAFTLLFVSSVVSPENRRSDRVFNACMAGFWWWAWYRWPPL